MEVEVQLLPEIDKTIYDTVFASSSFPVLKSQLVYF